MRPPSQSHLQPWKQINWMLFAVILLMLSFEVIASRFLIKTLPGFDGDLPFTLETGYIGVGESELFYYFIESEGNPDEDPLMFWLTGGPGCSGLSALLYEIGPLTINYANSNSEKTILEINPYSWTKLASIIFLDQPAGTGFSYARTYEAYLSNDTSSTMLSYNFLSKWLTDHPKFLNNRLYVVGDSYMGIVVPMVFEEIYKGNEVGEGLQMNIKGYLLGNPFTDTSGDYDSRIPYAHHMALLSDAIFKSTKENCHGEYLNIDPNNSLCIHDLQVVDKCIGRIRLAHILEPYCDTSNALESDILRRGSRTLEDTSVDISSLPHVQKQWCRDDNYLCSHVWANSRDVREALHVNEIITNILTTTRNLAILSGCDAMIACIFILTRKPYLTHMMSGVLSIIIDVLLINIVELLYTVETTTWLFRL